MPAVAARRTPRDGQDGAGTAGLAPATTSARLARDARVGRALRQVATALGASLELDELLDIVLKEVVTLLAAERAILFLQDERRPVLVSRAATRSEDMKLQLSLGDGWLSQVIRTGLSERIADCARSARPVEWDMASGRPTVAALLCPVKSNLGRTVGVLAVMNKRNGATFDADDEDTLSILVAQAAVAMDNSRLFMSLVRKNQELSQAQVQLTRRVRDLELLFELERRTAHARSQSDLARAVLMSLTKSCDAEGGALVMAEENAESFVQFVLGPRSSPTTAGADGAFHSNVYSPAEGLLGPVIQYSQPLQMDTSREPLRHDGFGQVRSVIAEPLEASDTPLGALALFNKRQGPFTAEDLGLLRLVSANVSTAVRLFHANLAREREERLTSIGRLLSQVVHDLKSPHTVISGYVELMEAAPSRAERRRYADEILKQFRALGAMQSEVLAFARGETRVLARKVILDRFFEDLRSRLEAELEGKHVELDIQSERRLVAHFDSERITRVLQNLVRNAAEAMSEQGGGRVTVFAGAHGNHLRLEVQDTGPGVPPDVAPRLFQSFVTSGKKGGTGLGLAIVKRIVEEHGGSIQLVDMPRGACFRIDLPQPARTAPPGPPPLPSKREQAPSRPKRKAAPAPAKRTRRRAE
jgi:signal transduction histidine kinase